MVDQDHAHAELVAEERRIESRSAEFRKELGLTDLVLTQVLFIVGLTWVGVAARQGPSHLLLWLGAMALFYIPSACVVIYLNRAMPLEGGVYQWAKLGFSDLVGFMAAWNLWLFAILNTSEVGLQVTQYFVYLAGPESESAASDPWVVGIVNTAVIALLVVITVIGLGVGKWVHKFGGALMLITFAAILALPVINWFNGTLPTDYKPLGFEIPVFSLMTVNLLSKMGFGAFGGFEYVAIHAGEARDPVRTIGRSVAIAAPIIAAMFILGTSSVLMLVPQEQIDLIAPVPQVLTIGFGPLGGAAAIGSMTVMALLSIRLAQSSVMFTGNTRLPMVAGWDNFLPQWFTRLHPRFRTPVNSIVFVGAVTAAMGIVGLIGVGKQEAFQILWNASGMFYATTYVVMFAIPLLSRKVEPAPPLWLKLLALSGLVMTLMYIGFAMVPIIEVENRLTFAAKIGGLLLVTNLIGFAIYKVRSRRQANVG